MSERAADVLCGGTVLSVFSAGQRRGSDRAVGCGFVTVTDGYRVRSIGSISLLQAASGLLKCTVTRNPFPALTGSICNVASCTSAIRLTMDNPKPLPLACVPNGR